MNIPDVVPQETWDELKLATDPNYQDAEFEAMALETDSFFDGLRKHLEERIEMPEPCGPENCELCRCMDRMAQQNALREWATCDKGHGRYTYLPSLPAEYHGCHMCITDDVEWVSRWIVQHKELIRLGVEELDEEHMAFLDEHLRVAIAKRNLSSPN